MSSTTLDGLIERLGDAVEAADPLLRARDEWKSLAQFHRDTLSQRDSGDGGSEVSEDLLREAEALLDLVELARAEVDELAQAESRDRQDRLREDERILAAIEADQKVYVGLVALGLFLPPMLLLMPLGVFLVLGVIPSLLGFSRMHSLQTPARGRVWIVLQDRVDQLMARVRILHAAALTSVLLTGVWVLVEVLAKRVAEQ